MCIDQMTEDGRQRTVFVGRVSVFLRNPTLLTLGYAMKPLTRPTKTAIPFADLRHEATMVDVGPISIPVASIEHLIAMKTGTGRSKDLIDIEELRKIQALK